jgi:hypothetical protein
VESHHPQPVAAVQVSQPAFAAHGSVVVHDVQAQSAHVPAEGPPEAPVRHSEVSPHQPQLLPAMQSPHVVLDWHGSVDAQALGTQDQSAHVPLEGPLEVPVMQASVVEHQPHPEAPVHSPQAR